MRGLGEGGNSKMNQGLTSDELKLLLELKTRANDEQVRTIRGIFEGEWKERQLRQKMVVQK